MIRTLVTCFFCLAALAASAQFQVGFSGGLSNYLGDLADKPFQKNLTQSVFGLHARYELSQRVMLRGGISFARVAGNDRYSDNAFRRARNLSFESNITELSLVGELHSFGLDQRAWSPYLFGGIAYLHYNPYTVDRAGQKYFLQPLGTEGQGLPGYPQKNLYALNQMALPFGAGMRFNVSPKVIISAELGYRTLFTDYLDDVSATYAAAADLQRYRGSTAVALAYRGDELQGGNPAYPGKGVQRGGPAKDSYYFTTLSFSFRLGEGGLFGSDSRKSGYGCPRF